MLCLFSWLQSQSLSWGSTLSEQPAAGAEQEKQQCGKGEREMVSETGSGSKAGSNWARL